MKALLPILLAAVFAAASALAQTTSCAIPGTNNDFLGIQTVRLWPGPAPQAGVEVPQRGVVGGDVHRPGTEGDDGLDRIGDASRRALGPPMAR